MSSSSKTVRVRLIKSVAGRSAQQRACVRGLGLRKLGSVRELSDTPEVRGMIRKINFMLEVS